MAAAALLLLSTVARRRRRRLPPCRRSRTGDAMPQLAGFLPGLPVVMLEEVPEGALAVGQHLVLAEQLPDRRAVFLGDSG